MRRLEAVKRDVLTLAIDQNGVKLGRALNNFERSIIGRLERLAECVMANENVRTG